MVCKQPDSVHRKPYRLHLKLLDLINELAKQQGSKPIFRNQRHSCIPTMKHQKQKSGEKLPFEIAIRKIKYLGINLTKEVKDLYSEN